MIGTFEGSRPEWLCRLSRVRNVVRQELIGRQLDLHLPPACSVLDVGAGQGTQSLRLARSGHLVTAVEPDVSMRHAFSSNLANETETVQRRTRLVDGSIEHLPATLRTFDAVLALGVLMYLPDPEAAVAELAARVAPGGHLALAVRTATSALWRAAARQDWQAAQAAIAADQAARRERRLVGYVNEIGARATAVDLDWLLARCADHGLVLENWYGIRIAVDTEEKDPPPPDNSDELAALLEVEHYLASRDPFRHLGQLAHVILVRPT